MRKENIDTYLHYKTVNNLHNSPNTTRSYRVVLNQWYAYYSVENMSKHMPIQERARHYRDHLAKIRDSKQVKIVLHILADFYSFLNQYYHSSTAHTENPFAELVKQFRVSKKESNAKRIKRDETVLTEIEVMMMLKQADTMTYHKSGLPYYFVHRNQLILKMLAKYGMRLSSLMSINLSDIDFRRRKIIVQSKNQKPYPLPIVNMVDDLRHHVEYVRGPAFVLAGIDAEDALFLSKDGKRLSDTYARKCINEIAAKVGLYKPQRSTHQLRHYRATRYYKEDMRVDLIAQIMGLSVPVLKETYLHITHDDTVREFEVWAQGSNKRFICPKCGYDERKSKPKLLEVRK